MNINGKENTKMINVEQVINILRTAMKTDQKYSSVLGNIHTFYKFLLCRPILDNATCSWHVMYLTFILIHFKHYPYLPFQFCGYSVWSQ